MKDLKKCLMQEGGNGHCAPWNMCSHSEETQAMEANCGPGPVSWARSSNFCKARSNGPSERGDPEEAWIRNICHFSLGLRKLFILFSPDCFIWHILGEMASSFPRVLEAACLFLQLAILQVGVTGTHMETWCHLWPHYSTEIQGLGRVSWAAEGRAQGGRCISHLHYRWLLFATLPRCLPKSSSLTVYWESLSQLNLLLMPPTSLATVSIISATFLKIPMLQGHAIQTVLGEAKLMSIKRVTRCPQFTWDCSSLYLCGCNSTPLFSQNWLEWQVIRTVYYKLFSKKGSFEWL